MPRKSRTSARKVAAAMHAAEVLKLRLEGLSYREIAEKCDVSAGHACRIIGQMLDEYAADTAERLDLWRRLELARLERGIAAVWPKAEAGSTSAIEQVRRLIESEIRLLGLAAPVKIAPTSPDGEREYGGLASLLREGDL